MSHNKVLLGSAAGLISFAAKHSIAQPLYFLGLLKATFIQLAAGIYLSPIRVHSLLGTIDGILADIVVCLLLGVVFVYLLGWTKPVFLQYQGVFFGLLVWLILYGGLIQFGVTHYRVRPDSDVLIMFFIHIVYGWALGWFVARFGKDAYHIKQL